MWAYIKYALKLRKLIKKRDKLRRRIERPFDEMEGTPELFADQFFILPTQLTEIEDEIERIRACRLVDTAYSLNIPLPSGEDCYYPRPGKNYLGRPPLNGQGKYQLLQSIRAERQARLAPIITVLTLSIGLIGAVTGLVSVLSE